MPRAREGSKPLLDGVLRIVATGEKEDGAVPQLDQRR
jgi:hypothetical protein